MFTEVMIGTNTSILLLTRTDTSTLLLSISHFHGALFFKHEHVHSASFKLGHYSASYVHGHFHSIARLYGTSIVLLIRLNMSIVFLISMDSLVL